MTRNVAERGVALPLVLFTILVLAILIAAGFAELGSERRVNANDESELDAFTLAQTGLETFIAQRATYGFTACAARCDGIDAHHVERRLRRCGCEADAYRFAGRPLRLRGPLARGQHRAGPVGDSPGGAHGF